MNCTLYMFSGASGFRWCCRHYGDSIDIEGDSSLTDPCEAYFSFSCREGALFFLRTAIVFPICRRRLLSEEKPDVLLPIKVVLMPQYFVILSFLLAAHGGLCCLSGRGVLYDCDGVLNSHWQQVLQPWRSDSFLMVQNHI